MDYGYGRITGMYNTSMYNTSMYNISMYNTGMYNTLSIEEVLTIRSSSYPTSFALSKEG